MTDITGLSAGDIGRLPSVRYEPVLLDYLVSGTVEQKAAAATAVRDRFCRFALRSRETVEALFQCATESEGELLVACLATILDIASPVEDQDALNRLIKNTRKKSQSSADAIFLVDEISARQELAKRWFAEKPGRTPEAQLPGLVNHLQFRLGLNAADRIEDLGVMRSVGRGHGPFSVAHKKLALAAERSIYFFGSIPFSKRNPLGDAVWNALVTYIDCYKAGGYWKARCHYVTPFEVFMNFADSDEGKQFIGYPDRRCYDSNEDYSYALQDRRADIEKSLGGYAHELMPAELEAPFVGAIRICAKCAEYASLSINEILDDRRYSEDDDDDDDDDDEVEYDDEREEEAVTTAGIFLSISFEELARDFVVTRIPLAEDWDDGWVPLEDSVAKRIEVAQRKGPFAIENSPLEVDWSDVLRKLVLYRERQYGGVYWVAEEGLDGFVTRYVDAMTCLRASGRRALLGRVEALLESELDICMPGRISVSDWDWA